MTAPSPAAPPDPTPFLPDADRIVDGLPWIVGRTPAQHRATRGRAAALVSQIAQMLASGCTVSEITVVLSGASMDGIGNAEGQEARWRKALKPPGRPAARRRNSSLPPAPRHPSLLRRLGP